MSLFLLDSSIFRPWQTSQVWADAGSDKAQYAGNSKSDEEETGQTVDGQLQVKIQKYEGPSVSAIRAIQICAQGTGCHGLSTLRVSACSRSCRVLPTIGMQTMSAI